MRVGADAAPSESNPSRIARRDPRPIPRVPGEVRAVLAVRNEMLRLPRLLDHYRAVGVGRFLVVDNASTDGSAAYLLSQPDVHSFHTDESFGASGFGMRWLHAVLDAFCDGHWTAVVDADELLVYPHCEAVGLGRFTAHLDAQGAEAVFAIMVDMYPAGPIREAHLAPGQSLLAACPHFDPGPYEERASVAFPHREVFGGPRRRIFWGRHGGGHHPPTLSKIPLVRWRRGMRFRLSQHAMTPAALADVSAALLHFKFLADFHDRALREAARGEHYDGAREYRTYARLLAENPDLSLFHACSAAYRDSAQLVACGLMRDSPAYRRFLAGDRVGAPAQALS
ncbi:MAG: glycosyltransferase family 2 protein [Alphaproteobacteria bacterium]|nr:glycosyltransferase family 2 protein [Alphaproteobacteria bacterium]